MPFNGSGGTSQPASSIYPASASTLIESAKFNISIADVYTMLGSCVLKDGQQTTTARVPFAAGISNGSQTLTAVAAGTATTHAATVGQIQSSAALLIGSVAGTNTITGALTPALAAYASGQQFYLVPANTNTGATTVNIDSVGAKNIFYRGVALGGGELVAARPYLIEYDGTQFNIIGGAVTPILSAEVATTSGTTADITGIPAWVRKITVMLAGVSTDGIGQYLLQLGDSGGIEATGYSCAFTAITAAGAVSCGLDTTAFRVADPGAAAATIHGLVVLTLQDAANFTWACGGQTARTDTAGQCIVAGTKALSAALDRIRLTNIGGANNFDAGAISILME